MLASFYGMVVKMKRHLTRNFRPFVPNYSLNSLTAKRSTVNELNFAAVKFRGLPKNLLLKI